MNFEIVSEEELFENEIFSEIESQEENEEMDGKFLLFLSNKSISQVKRNFTKAETAVPSVLYDSNEIENSDLLNDSNDIENSDLLNDSNDIDNNDLLNDSNDIDNNKFLNDSNEIENNDLLNESNDIENNDLLNNSNDIENNDLLNNSNEIENNEFSNDSNDIENIEFSDLDCDSFIDGNDFLNSSGSTSEEEIILNERINENLTSDKEDVFENAKISLDEFRRSFLILQHKFSLSPFQSKGVFEFVKVLFPNSHKLTTYNKLVCAFKSHEPIMSKACLICCKPLKAKDICQEKSCVSKRQKHKLAKYTDPVVIVFSFRKHMQYIIEDKFENICTYRGKISLCEIN